MSKIRTITDAIALARHPKSAWLHLRWHWNGKRNRAVRLHLRQAFSDKFYLETYPEVRRLRIGPVRHYILRGWREGKDPSELFSTEAYLRMYSDVRDARVNPFHHYLVHGKQEGRSASVSVAGRGALSRPGSLLVVPPLPAMAELAALPRAVVDPATAPAVNIVIPVYRSLKHTAATIYSVLKAKCDTPFECVVIDDASPEPAVSALLRDLAASGHIRLLVNESNLGFVRSVNRGMAHNSHRDVVLLNSDTWVSDGWLDRLVMPFRDEPTIATVTPFSNNATIASYPNNVVDNAYELETDPGTLDRLAAEANGSTVIDVPTGVGFCMAIRRKALDELGPFDAETFGLGYGEECDFCARAIKAGWRNVIATGVYVRHYGSASFGPSQLARSGEAQRLLAAKHPDYAGRVGRHIATDPTLASRILFDTARLREALGPISVLFFTHSRGGGIDTYLRNTRITLKGSGLRDVLDRAILLEHQLDGFVKVKAFGSRPIPYLPNFQGLNLRRHNALVPRIIELLKPELIQINSFAGLSLPAIAGLMDAIEGSKAPFWHVWHDHQPLCPRLTFLDAEERYCGETDASRCHSCLAASGSDLEWVKIEDWRERFRKYLAKAEVVSAPSEAAALRARRLADVSKVKVHPHPEPQIVDVGPAMRKAHEDGKRHVLILGAIGPHKGSYLLHAMLKDISARNLPLHLEIVGYTSVGEIVTGPNCTVHGKYQGDADAVRRILKLRPDVCLFSSIWPETYVYTVSVAMALSLPAVSFDLGAQAERLRGYGRGAVLPARLMEDPVALNGALLDLDLDTLWAGAVQPEFAHACALSSHYLRERQDQAPAAPATVAFRPAHRRAAARAPGTAAQSDDRMSLRL